MFSEQLLNYKLLTHNTQLDLHKANDFKKHFSRREQHPQQSRLN